MKLSSNALDFPFTASDTPELRGRIGRDLDTVTRILARRDGAARALVLTGGFARGEGSVVGDRPLNDYDLVLVRDLPGGLDLAREAAAEATRDVGLEVDLVPVWTARLPWVSPKLFWVEARSIGRVVAGDRRVLDLLPARPPSDVPRGEARRLLVNRAVGLLEGSAFGEEAARWHAAKAILAAIEARLLARGLHHASVAVRLARLRALGLEREIPLSGWATAFKLDPTSHASEDASSTWATARKVLLETHALLFPGEARATVAEIAYHASKARRIVLDPSGAVRRVALEALRATESPVGPDKTALAKLNLSLAALGAKTAPTDWPGWVRAFLDVRAATLQ